MNDSNQSNCIKESGFISRSRLLVWARVPVCGRLKAPACRGSDISVESRHVTDRSDL